MSIILRSSRKYSKHIETNKDKKPIHYIKLVLNKVVLMQIIMALAKAVFLNKEIFYKTYRHKQIKANPCSLYTNK